MKLKEIALAVFIVIAISGCDSKTETYDNGTGVVQVKNDYYKDQRDCLEDWGHKQYCKPEIEAPYLTGANTGYWSGIGPDKSRSPLDKKDEEEKIQEQQLASTDQSNNVSSGSGYHGGYHGGYYGGFYGPSYVQNGNYGSRAFVNDKGEIVKAKANNASRSVTTKVDARYGNKLAVSSDLAKSLSKGTNSASKVAQARSGSRGYFTGGRTSGARGGFSG